MLWYKSWLETRLKLLISIGYLAVLMFMSHTHPLRMPGGRAGNPALEPVLLMGTTFAAVICIWLAGAGVVTQPSFQATKGIHGSTLFTLSLPVSRFRLLAVRAGLRWMEMTVMIGALCCGMWLVHPAMRALVTPIAMLEYSATLLVCASAFYFFSVLLATLLEDQWRMVGGMVAFGGMFWLSAYKYLPASVDPLRATGRGSLLIAHTVPWSAMGFSVGLSAALLVAALKVVQVREY
jgi:hypothetical protein